MDEVAPGIATGLSRGRILFNRADFWGSHEALEPAWRASTGELRLLLQGLIQAGAAFHKYVVQDNPVGSRHLLRAALEKLDQCPSDALGLALTPFRAELRVWLERVGSSPSASGPVVGLPRIEWGFGGLAARIAVDSVELHQVEHGARRAILVGVTAGNLVGWGECRHPWGTYGVWDSLVSGLVPALLAEPVSTPVELPLLWSGIGAAAYARAGLEAAVWDVWSRQRGVSLVEALGHDRRSVALFGAVSAGDVEHLAGAADACADRGYRQLLLPARPNADRRVLPELVRRCRVPVAFDLGEAYRAADITALSVLDGLGAQMLSRPVPATDLATISALGRWLVTPISVDGWVTAQQLASALSFVDLDIISLDPGRIGLTESVDMLGVAAEHEVPAWVHGSASSSIGAAADLALAAHPAVALPCCLSTARDEAMAVCVRPAEDGSAWPSPAPGIGVVPDPAWLARVTSRRAVLGSKRV
jgi:O-succinylbenzoate synthase